MGAIDCKICGKPIREHSGYECQSPAEMPETKRFRCKLCGRDKFYRPMPHNCKIGGSPFLKRINRAARVRGMDSIFEEVATNKLQEGR